jgi:uncharacterized SAM-binding protein YcdF (DUF218 family)
MNQAEIDKNAQIIWDFHLMHHELKEADCILVLGSHDLRVAECGAQLFLDKYAPLIIFSGGIGRLTESWDLPEAEMFAEIAQRMGVPKDRILIENKATNTGENIQFVKKLAQEHGLNLNKIITVQKPYMERRTFATFKKQWPGPELIISSPLLSFTEYCNEEYPKDRVISIMIGDLRRIKEYPAKSFQIPQEIPAEVWHAYEELVKLGIQEK